MQPEPTLPQDPQPEPSMTPEAQPAAPIAPPPVLPVAKPKKSPNLGMIFLGLVALLLLCALAGVGYWAYQLNTQLTATQGNLTTLQGNFDKLTTEKNSLSSELDAAKSELATTKTELDTTKADLATAQGDLKTAQDKAASLQKTVDKARKYADVLKGMFVDDDSFTESSLKVAATNDSSLKSKFDAFDKSRSSRDFASFLEYLCTILVEVLK